MRHVKIKLLIIDDHPLVSDGIATMLKDIDWLQIAATCKSGESALEYLQDHEPEIILLDISLPGMNGLDLCREIRVKNKISKIIGLTSANETALIAQMLHNGADGYLLKNMERSELLTAIETVMDGHRYLSREANEKLLEHFTSVGDALKHQPVLTRREKEILGLLENGLTGPQIAAKLFLSPYTVETHRKNLMQKFNANNLQQLLKLARESRLI
jgi:DNA-binding NarL/FixJ family response regulator